MSPSLNGGMISNTGTRTRLVSQASILSQPDLLSPDELFTQYTVNEIQRNHKKIQRDIESKKGELRTMVGERYRELIDTADTIASMEDTVKNIQATLSSIEHSCKLERNTSVEEVEEHNKKEEFWSIASQMKLLVDTPEKIWNAMEKKNFLIAGQLYLLSRHIVTNLHIGSGTGGSQLLTQFPVLPQQWGAISHFKSSILQGCREMLEEVEVTDTQFTDSVCTIILLEGVSLADLLQDFLSKRLSAVSRHLTSGGSVRNQLANCVTSIKCTLQMIYNNVLSNNHILDKLQHLCNRVSTIQVITVAFQQETSLQSITRHLPTLVHSYHPTINSSLELPDMRELCEKWCVDTTELIHNTLHKTLHYVNSVSSIANLTKPYSQKGTSEWEVVCERVLDRHLNLWEDMLMIPINNHVKSIIETYLQDALRSTNADIAKCLENLAQADVSELVWGGVAKKDATLSLKTEAYTTDVYRTCEELNERLSVLYKDIVSYTGAPEKSRYKDSHIQCEEVFVHIHHVTDTCLEQLAHHISNILPHSTEISHCSGSTDVLAILIHLCRCLVAHTPQLRKLLTPPACPAGAPRTPHSTPTNVYACIDQTKSGLIRRYGDWLSVTLSEHLAGLLSSTPLPFAVVWEEVTITEESENAGSVESAISLPIYTSTYITSVLYSLCDELYRIGCHGYEDSDMCALLSGINGRIIGVYDTWLEEAELTQNMALQYWFDFKYITTLCNVSSNAMIASVATMTEQNKKISNIIRRIENHIDPFDWDVFQPHLTSNLHGLIRRTFNLYSSVSRYSTTTQAICSTSRTSIQQNTHNILPSNELVQRFSLLPVRSEEQAADSDSGEELPQQLNNLCTNLAYFTSPTLS